MHNSHMLLGHTLYVTLLARRKLRFRANVSTSSANVKRA